MCGIVCYWAKESVLSRKEYDILLRGAEKRGQDGIGVCIINQNNLFKSTKWTGSYMSSQEKILNFVEENMRVNSILLVSCRATPETEKTTTKDMIQPLIQSPLYLIHNGGITDSVKNEFSTYTPLDSEAIVSAYLHFNLNLKEALEYLSGSWAFVMLDTKKRKLYAGCSFNPLAHMYIKGYGYFLHSSNDTLAEVLKWRTGATRNGMSVWESWYHHYIEGYTIIETDLESGFQFKQKYKPRFLHPVWDNIQKHSKTKTLVCCSGGIDSGLTANILYLAGHDVELVHFIYGQKSYASEMFAVDMLGKFLGRKVTIFDLSDVYRTINDQSMLLDKDIEITSGGDDLKSTIAWVAGRNAIFSSIIMAMAEAYILREKYEKVYISAGWSQLSEETGGYPDNSFKFSEAINELKDYGYITGSRIEFLPVMQNLTKTEEWKLGDAIHFPFNITVSCDDPEIRHHNIYQCVECGSTKLSILAADRACVFDPRNFKSRRPKLVGPMKLPDIRNIVDRLLLTKEEKERINDIIV